MKAQSLRELLLPLSLDTIKEFLCFIVTTSQGIIDNGQSKVTVDSMNISAEWLFAGIARATGSRTDEEDRCAVYGISALLLQPNSSKLNRTLSVDEKYPDQRRPGCESEKVKALIR